LKQYTFHTKRRAVTSYVTIVITLQLNFLYVQLATCSIKQFATSGHCKWD